MYNKKYPCTNTVIDDSKFESSMIKSRIKSKINFKKLSEQCYQCPKCHNTYRTRGNAKRHYYDICILNDDVYEVSDDVEMNNNDIPNDGKHICDAISGGLENFSPILHRSRDGLESIHNNTPHIGNPIDGINLDHLKTKDKPMISDLEHNNHDNPINEEHNNDIDLDALERKISDFRRFSAHQTGVCNTPNITVSSSSTNTNTTIYKPKNPSINSVGAAGAAGATIDSDNESNAESNNNVIEESHICSYCKQSFSRKFCLMRHQADRCKKKLQIEQAKKESIGMEQQMIAEMIIQMKEMQQKINELECKNDTAITGNTIKAVTNSNNNSNSNNTIQTINNDIKIIAFGKEDLYSLLDDEQAKKYLNHGYQSVYNLIEYMHFNPDKPELHSVYISNMFHPYAHQFDGERWQTVDKDEAIDQLFDDKACYLNAMFKELKNQLAKKTIDKYSRFMNDTDEKVIENIKNDIKKLLYNKRHIPLATKKKMGL